MKASTTFFAALFAAASLHAASIDQVIVRQQWPWSTAVKVEYKLSGVTTPVDISVKAYDGDEELDGSNLASAITGDTYGIAKSGIGEFFIDPVKAFGKSSVALADFRVELEVSESAANINEVIYKVFCLTNATCTDITKKEILNGKYGSYETDYSKFGSDFTTPWSDVLVWTAVTNDLKYMTTHLVMRKIPATNQVWQIGGSSGFSQHWVKLTEEYFIGVFPVTVEQHRLMDGGAAPSAPLTESDALPKGSMNIVVTRGTRTPGSNVSLMSMKNKEPVFWPTNSYVHDLCANYSLGKMRNRFKIDFDLPSDAQWEVACRAGTVGNVLYNGKAIGVAANVWELGWINSNSSSTLRRVGLKAPNPFGLYDLYGSVAELTPCLNTADQTDRGDAEDNPRVDPLSARGGDDHIIKRGGAVDLDISWANSSARNGWFGWTEYKDFVGYRVVIPAGKTTWNQ